MMYLFNKIGHYNIILVLYNFYINEDILSKDPYRMFYGQKV